MRLIPLAVDILMISTLLAAVRRIGNYEIRTDRISNFIVRFVVAQLILIGDSVLDTAISFAHQYPEIFQPRDNSIILSSNHGVNHLPRAPQQAHRDIRTDNSVVITAEALGWSGAGLSRGRRDVPRDERDESPSPSKRGFFDDHSQRLIMAGPQPNKKERTERRTRGVSQPR